MMYVEDKDLNNPELTMLPIRKGCGGGPCACSGYCREIAGDIDRTMYEAFLKMYVSHDDFFKRNMVTHVPKENGRTIMKSIQIDWPTQGANKYKVMMALKNKLFIDNATWLNKLISTRYFRNGEGNMFSGIAINWDLYKAILDENGVKYDVTYEADRD